MELLNPRRGHRTKSGRICASSNGYNQGEGFSDAKVGQQQGRRDVGPEAIDVLQRNENDGLTDGKQSQGRGRVGAHWRTPVRIPKGGSNLTQKAITIKMNFSLFGNYSATS